MHTTGNWEFHQATNKLLFGHNCHPIDPVEKKYKKWLYTVTENLPFERLRFLKLSEFKQWKFFVKIGQNFKAKLS